MSTCMLLELDLQSVYGSMQLRPLHILEMGVTILELPRLNFKPSVTRTASAQNVSLVYMKRRNYMSVVQSVRLYVLIE